jgi:hypothetical protein
VCCDGERNPTPYFQLIADIHARSVLGRCQSANLQIGMIWVM